MKGYRVRLCGGTLDMFFIQEWPQSRCGDGAVDLSHGTSGSCWRWPVPVPARVTARWLGHRTRVRSEGWSQQKNLSWVGLGVVFFFWSFRWRMMKGFATRASPGGGLTGPRARPHTRRLLRGEMRERRAPSALKTTFAKLETPNPGENHFNLQEENAPNLSS